MEKLFNNKPIQGIINSTDPIDQPENSLTFALNTITDSVEGSKNSYQTEPGNEDCFDLPEGYTPIGRVNGDPRELFVFSSSEDSSEIGRVYNCKYETLVNAPCLEFSKCNKIKAIYRKKNGCERILYFVDGENPDRFFNVDKPEEFQDDEGNWNCDLFNQSPKNKEVCIELEEIRNSGGSLDLGVYYFAIETLDADENVIYTSSLSKSVGIYDESSSTDWDSIDGGHNVGIDNVFGPTSPASKSIVLNVSNIDTNYSYLRILAVRATTGDGVTVDVVQTGELIPITSDNQSLVYRGFSEANGDIYRDIDDILIPRAIYDTSEAISQVQNRLVRANLKGPSVDMAELQKSVAGVGVKYKIKEVDADTVINGNPKDGTTWFNAMSFMGDEVYGLGIAYVFDTGYVAPPVVLTGRPKNVDTCLCDTIAPDKILYEGEQKCIVLTAKAVRNVDVSLDVVVKYKVNGVQVNRSYLVQVGKSNRDFEVFVYCDSVQEFNNSITDVELQLLHPNPRELKDKLDISVGFKTRNIGNGHTVLSYTGKSPLLGWDDTVYPYWFEDMSHLEGARTEEEYKILIESVGGEYGDSGSALSRDNLILLRDALPEYQRWKIFNTAVKLDDYSGLMGYYECETSVYPEILDCEGESIWGNDCTGKPIAGQKIRHFRMPCRSLEPHYTTPESNNDNEFEEGKDGKIRLIGLEVCNLEYPNDKIVGHYIMMMKRTDADKTVLDTGYGHRMHRFEDQVGFANFFYNRRDNEHSWFMHPKLSFYGQAADPDYIKVNGLVYGYRTRHDDNCDFVAGDTRDPSVYISHRYSIAGGLEVSGEGNYPVDAGTRMPIMSRKTDVFGEDGELINLSMSNEVVGYKHTRDFPVWTQRYQPDNGTVPELYYGTMKASREVYCNIFNRQFVKLHSCMSTLEEPQEFFGGDTFVSQLNISNIHIHNVEGGILSLIIAAALIVVGVVTAAFGGAALIFAGVAIAAGALAFATYSVVLDLISEGHFNDFLADPWIILNGCTGCDYQENSLGNNICYVGEHLHNLWVESEINTSMRHEAPTEGGNHFKGEPGFTGLRNYYKDRILYLHDPESNNDKYRIRGIVLPEVYLYNKDYSLVDFSNSFFSLPASYDYCSKCENHYPYRLIWSEKSFDSDKQDKYRITLANNFKDIKGDKGEITDIKEKANQLIVHTEHNAVILRPNPQVLRTDQGSAYLGTGDFLAIDPVDLVETDIGFGGKISKYSDINSEFGYFWVDENLGNILRFNGQIEKVGLNRLDKWLRTNLKPIFKEQVKCFTDGEFNCDTLNIVSTFDPYFNRFIFTKIDYELKEEYLNNFYVDEGKVFLRTEDSEIDIKFNDPEYFINKSWTLSFDLEGNYFISYHSYIPSLYMNDSDNFYSFNNNTCWKHLHKGNFSTFYNRKFDSIIEIPIKDYSTHDLHATYFIGETKEYDEENNKWISENSTTFDRGLVYNSCGSTGLFNIEFLDSHNDPYQNTLYDPNTKFIALSEGNYKLSEIFDLSSNEPFLTSNWNNLTFRSNFNIDGNNGYIDCVSLEENIDRDNVYDAATPKDKWVKLRLYFNPEKDLKQVLYISSFNQHPSTR